MGTAEEIRAGREQSEGFATTPSSTCEGSENLSGAIIGRK